MRIRSGTSFVIGTAIACLTACGSGSRAPEVRVDPTPTRLSTEWVATGFRSVSAATHAVKASGERIAVWADSLDAEAGRSVTRFAVAADGISFGEPAVLRRYATPLEVCANETGYLVALWDEIVGETVLLWTDGRSVRSAHRLERSLRSPLRLAPSADGFAAGWIQGSDFWVSRFDGTAWTDERLDDRDVLFFALASNGTGYAAVSTDASTGTADARVFDGASWSPPSPLVSNATSCSLTSGGQGYNVVASANGAIYAARFDSGTWHATQLATRFSLFAHHAWSGGYAVLTRFSGEVAQVFRRRDGEDWQLPVAIPDSEASSSLALAGSADHLVATWIDLGGIPGNQRVMASQDLGSGFGPAVLLGVGSPARTIGVFATPQRAGVLWTTQATTASADVVARTWSPSGWSSELRADIPTSRSPGT